MASRRHLDPKRARVITMKAALVCFSIAFLATALVFVFLVCKPVFSAPKDLSTSSKVPSTGVCTSKSCMQTARTLRQNLNSEVDPCEDFYSFACGHFAEHNPLPEDKTSIGHTEKTIERVKNLLMKSLSVDGPNDEARPLKFARQLFQKCTDKGESVDKKR